MLPEHLKGICKKCAHYPTCTRPCYPVKQYLYEKGEAFEKSGVLYPLHKQIPLSVCMKESHDGKEAPNDEERLLSTELESPFQTFQVKLKTTYCFIHRFFLKDSFKDIGHMLSISDKSAEVLYRAAVEKILDKLIEKSVDMHSNIYLDTVISPSYTSAIAQIIQLPSISGLENNMIIFEFETALPVLVGLFIGYIYQLPVPNV